MEDAKQKVNPKLIELLNTFGHRGGGRRGGGRGSGRGGGRGGGSRYGGGRDFGPPMPSGTSY